jgi:AcrR family transcriptional regulator
VQRDGQNEPSGPVDGTRRSGRPVDRSKDAQILALTLDALVDRTYDQVTLDEIALQAGTAKTTLYRRWPTKTALVLAAIRSVGRPPESEDLPDEGSLRADLLAVIDSPWLGGPDRRLAILAGLASAAHGSSALGDAVRAQITAPYIEVYRALLARAVERGLLPRSVDRRTALLAEVIPAMSTQRLSSGDSIIGRSYYVAIVDDVLLPSLQQART